MLSRLQPVLEAQHPVVRRTLVVSFHWSSDGHPGGLHLRDVENWVTMNRTYVFSFGGRIDITRNMSAGEAREERLGSHRPRAPSSAAVSPLNSGPRLRHPVHRVDKEPGPRDTPRVTAGKGSLLAVMCDVQVDLPPSLPWSLPFSASRLLLPHAWERLWSKAASSQDVAEETGGDWGRHGITRP